VATPINQRYSTLYQIDTTKTAETQPDPIGAARVEKNAECYLPFAVIGVSLA
jgi:hypothetical protein